MSKYSDKKKKFKATQLNRDNVRIVEAIENTQSEYKGIIRGKYISDKSDTFACGNPQRSTFILDDNDGRHINTRFQTNSRTSIRRSFSQQ